MTVGMSVEPGTLNLEVMPGGRLELRLTWQDEDLQPADLTDYWACLQVRWAPAGAEPLLDLTSEADGGIVLGGETGTIDISRDLPVGTRPGVYEWDLRLVGPDGAPVVLMRGRFDVPRLVSRRNPQ